MRNRKIASLTAMTALAALVLSGCASMDESFLSSEANYGVDIAVPYATATPLPEYLDVPDAIVIDSDGNVTLNDASVIEGDFQSTRAQTQQTEYRSLTLGSTGIAVQALQSRLAELGYYAGEISGVYDVDTEAAVRRFEQTFGTMQTGVATSKLQLRLFSSSAPVYMSEEYDEAVVSQYAVLRPGAVGSSVYALQQRLKNLGYPILDLTGAYDAQTAYCVRLFYMSYGIASSDVADINMQRRLYSEDAHAYDASVQVSTTLQPYVEGETVFPGTEASENANEETLAVGMTGERVSEIQARLIALGYMPEDGNTGSFDQATFGAVNRFLQSIGREPTGTLDAEMQNYLLSDSAPSFGGNASTAEYRDLAPGDRGDAVVNLQRRLVELGYANGNPNGQYGNATVSAVKLFQQANGIEPDGLASAWLQATMFSTTATTYQEARAMIEAQATPEPTATPEPVEAGDTLFFNLSLGSTGNAVEELQARLIALGYTLTNTNTYDEQTRQAVIAFQTAIGVTPTGEASATLQRYIYSKAAPGPTVVFYVNPQTFVQLQAGDSGDNVTKLQQQLFTLKYLKREDIQDSIGVYNEATRNAVSQAQRVMGYQSPDGIAGVEFQSFLFSRFAKKIQR